MPLSVKLRALLKDKRSLLLSPPRILLKLVTNSEPPLISVLSSKMPILNTKPKPPNQKEDGNSPPMLCSSD